MPVRKKHILDLATELLHRTGTAKPPVPIEEIAKGCGLKIRLQPLESDISGFVVKQDGHGVIGVNSAQAPVRQRFTVAHELGHYLLHEQAKWHVDRSVSVRFRSKLSSQGTDSDEIEANLFAAEMLMPRELIQKDMDQLDAVEILDDDMIMKMARRYNVSSQALLVRLTALGYVENDVA